MARAIEWAIGCTRNDGRALLIVNAGSDNWNYQIKDLADAVDQAIPGTEVSINKDAQPNGLFKSLAPDHAAQISPAGLHCGPERRLTAMGF